VELKRLAVDRKVHDEVMETFQRRRTESNGTGDLTVRRSPGYLAFPFASFSIMANRLRWKSAAKVSPALVALSSSA